jgi:hypothetical protein
MAGKAAGWSLVVLAALVLGVSGAGGRSLAATTLTQQVIGGGNVTADGGQINCGAGAKACYFSTSGTGTVVLTANAESGWTFASWSGGCAAVANDCTITLDGTDHEVFANFTPSPNPGTSTLTVSVSSNTSADGGTVEGGSIDCGSSCDWTEYTGSTLTVLETPDTGYAFSGWGGDCSGSGKSCTVELSDDASVSATFVQSSTTSTLSVSVSGQGTVTGGGIACTSAGGTGCSASVTTGSSVTLTATPTAGASFLGWGGACAGTAVTCAVTVNGSTTVTAGFSGGGGGTTFPVTVTVTGNGSVTGGGIACGNGDSDCSATFAAGSSVTLTAAPASGASFTGWGGACTGTSSTCKLTINAAKAVTATFTGGGAAPPAAGPSLTLKVAGRGKVFAAAGTCSSTGPAKTCKQSYDAGATVRLTATPASGARFLGWGGACAGTSLTCTVKLTGSTTVTATFSGASAGAALARRGRPVVRRVEGGFQVTLRFRAGTRGTAHVRALRAGRVETGLSFTAAPGPGTIGPFQVRKPGYYVFELRLGRGMLQWRACLGRCGAGAPGGPFTVVREPAGVVHAGQAWSVTIHFRANRPAGAELRISRGRALVKDVRVATSPGEASAGPFVLTPGTYALRLTVTDAYGRTHPLTWLAFLPG